MSKELKVGDFLWGGFRGGPYQTRVRRVFKDSIRVDSTPAIIIDKTTLRGRSDYDHQYKFFTTLEEAEADSALGAEVERFFGKLKSRYAPMELTREEFEQIKSILGKFVK